MSRPTARTLGAEFLGSLILFATVIGSGIMAERLAGGNVAVALLGNTLATGAVLYVLITALGPVSGAQFNPAVTLMLAPCAQWGALVVAQLLGGLAGMVLAHGMFDMPLIEIGVKTRTGIGQWLGEFTATFGLLFTIVTASRVRPTAVPALVALWIVAGYWFTSSTSFANPAITLARALTDSFSGIRPVDAPAFILAQFAGAWAGARVGNWLTAELPASVGREIL